ncbi:MAG: hypothetical protein MUQ10_04785, partial [Anaerolineae bacterium]|nr:hypothetical protein [Anaerolineae bacterium]
QYTVTIVQWAAHLPVASVDVGAWGRPLAVLFYVVLFGGLGLRYLWNREDPGIPTPSRRAVVLALAGVIPLWLGVGLNCMYPLEVRAQNDVVALREIYGRDLLVIGGFDKFPLLEGKEAILAEFRRLEPVAHDGGFIPHIDHRCPGGVPYDNYRYYIREKCAFLGMSEAEISRIPALADVAPDRA